MLSASNAGQGMSAVDGLPVAAKLAHFSRSKFTGESPELTGAGTSGGMVFFHAAEFSGGTVSFAGAEVPGGPVGFAGAGFSGGTVDFSRVASWTQPPDFGSGFDMSHPPAGVTLPTATSPSPDLEH